MPTELLWFFSTSIKDAVFRGPYGVAQFLLHIGLVAVQGYVNANTTSQHFPDHRLSCILDLLIS